MLFSKSQNKPLDLPFVLVVLLALLPRVTGLDDFLTFDEAYHWIGRTERFAAGVAAGDWAATYQTGHPGVSLMWLGSIGILLERVLQTQDWLAPASPTLLEHLALMRLPVALAHTAAVGAGLLLLRRLVPARVAFFAAVLWACSPFLIAHARLLHMDGLLTDFVMLCLLSILIACGYARCTFGQDILDRNAAVSERNAYPDSVSPCLHGEKLRGVLWLLVAALFAGLALLTKGPALILLPSVGLLLFWLLPASSLWQRLYRSLVSYALWLGGALLVVVALWFALWVEPQQTITRYLAKIYGEGMYPYVKAQFFFGQTVSDPGVFFYPVVLVFRLSPIVLGGLALAPLALRLRCRDVACNSMNRDTSPPSPPAPSPIKGEGEPFIPLLPAVGEGAGDGGCPKGQGMGQEQRDVRKGAYTVSTQWVLPALAAFVLFWLLVMTLGAKKFDRYILPALPPMLVLAAAGWDALLLRVRERVVSIALITGVSIMVLAPVVRYFPHYLSYYNPAAGGGESAHRVLLTGWGEGYDRVGAYLRSRPDATYAPVLATDTRLLEPFVDVPVLPIDEVGEHIANYAVIDLPSYQRNLYPAPFATIQQQPALHHVMLHGIPYAAIYQLPRPYEQPVGAQFGDWLRLHGVTVMQQPGVVTVTPSWGVVAAPSTIPYRVFVHMVDATGQKVAQADVAPGGTDLPPTSAWQVGQQVSVPLPLPLPADIAEGEYTLLMGLYAEDGTRLGLRRGNLAPVSLAGPDALLLGTVMVR